MKLETGDVIVLNNGAKVYGLIAQKFVYMNCRGDNKQTRTEVEIGKTYENNFNVEEFIDLMVQDISKKFYNNGFYVDRKKTIKFVKDNVEVHKPESFVIEPGEFVVIKTAFDGGGTGHGPHDVYPDGHHVFCKRLKNGKYDKDGDEVDFYQSGCFTCVIKDIVPSGKMEMKFI